MKVLGGERNKKNLAQLINASALAAFYSFAILWPLNIRSLQLATVLLGVIICVCLCVQPSTKNHPLRPPIIYLALMLSLSAVVVIVYSQAKFSSYAVNSLAAVGLVFAVHLIRPIHTRVPLYVAISVIGWLVYWRVDIDESIIAIGQNGITLHVMVFYVIYFFRMLYPLGDKVSRFVKYENCVFAALLFTLSVWSQGRASTVVALVILVVAAFILVNEFSGMKKLGVVLASLLIVVFNYFSPPLMGERSYNVGSLYRIEMAGFSDVRYKVWADYFQTLTPESLVTGNRDSNCHTMLPGYTRENCNVHSSYLRAHQVYGLFGVFIILLIVFWCFRRFAQSGEWYAMTIFSALLLRVATDEAFFISPYIFALLFIYAKATDGVELRRCVWSAK